MEHRLIQSILAQRARELPSDKVCLTLLISAAKLTSSFRCLLGFLQGGFIPDVILYLSYFYTKNELPIRLAWFWMSNYMDKIVGAFLATGILKLRGHGVAGWRYLFLIEGLLTCLVGLFSFVLMPPGPTQTRTWYRPKGWYSER